MKREAVGGSQRGFDCNVVGPTIAAIGQRTRAIVLRRRQHELGPRVGEMTELEAVGFAAAIAHCEPAIEARQISHRNEFVRRRRKRHRRSGDGCDKRCK
jgi:hypothetical protein